MEYYRFKNKYIVASEKLKLLDGMIKINEDEIKKSEDFYYLFDSSPLNTRTSFCISDECDLSTHNEYIDILKEHTFSVSSIPEWMKRIIQKGHAAAINIKWPSWENKLKEGIIQNKSKNIWNINIAGMGDVGGTLCTGLRLLGGGLVNKIGIYDKDMNKSKRWEYELNQIYYPNGSTDMPHINIIDEDSLFDCDMFIFCISVGVPPLGEKSSDVRMAQFEGNSKIMSYYAKLSSRQNFKGIFAIVSDPVDLLCKTAFIESNKNSDGTLNFSGLSSDRIFGYGLGVMYARAAYYAQKNDKYSYFKKSGRAFGPHGEGLIIADSMDNYNEEVSEYLTQKAKHSNIDIRKTGFKPFVAPALSSGTLSIISTLKNEWHYSSVFIGGSFFGVRNRLSSYGTQIEKYNMPEKLFTKIAKSYEQIREL